MVLNTLGEIVLIKTNLPFRLVATITFFFFLVKIGVSYERDFFEIQNRE